MVTLEDLILEWIGLPNDNASIMEFCLRVPMDLKIPFLSWLTNLQGSIDGSDRGLTN